MTSVAAVGAPAGAMVGALINAAPARLTGELVTLARQKRARPRGSCASKQSARG